jgi:hypothetical protein
VFLLGQSVMTTKRISFLLQEGNKRYECVTSGEDMCTVPYKKACFGIKEVSFLKQNYYYSHTVKYFIS